MTMFWYTRFTALIRYSAYATELLRPYLLILTDFKFKN